MRRISILAFIVSYTALLTVSCSKSSNSTSNTNTTVAEDKTFINNTFNGTISCVTTARDGSFMQTMFKMYGLSNGNSSNESWVNNMTDKLEIAMGKLKLGDDSKFNYSNYAATYTWNFNTNNWTKTASNTITINFPSEPSKTTNNCSFKFTNFSDGQYQANAKTIFLPTVGKMTLDKDGSQVMSLDFTSNYSTGNFPAPINSALTLNLNPHNYKLNISRINPTQFNLAIELGGDCGSTINSKVSFKNDDYNNFKLEDDLDKVELTYSKGEFSIQANWDARTYYALSNPNTNSINSTLVAAVYYKTAKIGDLRFTDVAGQRKLFIYYKDGTGENTSFYYDPFGTQLKNVLRPYFGNDVDSWF